MRYRQDVPRDAGLDEVIAHVRAHLASLAHPEDDPREFAQRVTVTVADHIDGDPSLVSVIGELDAEPDAPYLREDYTPDGTGSDLPLALDRDPTDLNADEYTAHMIRKEQWS